MKEKTHIPLITQVAPRIFGLRFIKQEDIMNIIELSALPNGAHRNMDSYVWMVPPEGWAMIPEEMELPETFPFVGVEAEEIDGVMTVTVLTPGTMPEPDLDPIKTRRIAQSKTDLATYLESHPLQWTDGEYYSITAERQSQLTGTIVAAHADGQPPEWNSTGGVCREWDVSELMDLAVAIKDRVKALVKYQQTQEVAMRNATTLEELNAVVVNYDCVEVPT